MSSTDIDNDNAFLLYSMPITTRSMNYSYKVQASVNYFRNFHHFSNNNSNIDLYQFVEDVNKFSRQKRGGQHPGPSGPPTNVCVLCSSGAAVCLGSACMGKKTQVSTIAMESTEVTRPIPSSTIPGLVFAFDRYLMIF